ncbi:MAG TPA: PilZ domain-containing protein [Candidatus Baltobacteraceae bacterium]|jgi:PilZ domain|nr:PilZ domain-containing protein [Candidatus Baltobacteraceae bacterium]
MGRRGEPRIAVTFPVVVRGADSKGTPFVLTAETRDVSCSGACLRGLSGIVVSGRKVEVECGDQRAWYRIQWAGAAGSSKAGQAGLRCLEPGKYIWGVPPKEWHADSYDPSRPDTALSQPPSAAPSVQSGPWTGRERRQFVRHTCRMAAQIVLQNGSVRMTATVTDISLGGCYVEMLSPLPVDTFCDIAISPGDTTLQLSGRVRSSQTNFGMGVSFTGMRPQDFEVLRKLAPPTVNPQEPDTPVAIPSAPSARQNDSHGYAANDFDSVDLPTTPEALAAAVRVLIRKGAVTRAEIMEELEKLKVPRS